MKKIIILLGLFLSFNIGAMVPIKEVLDTKGVQVKGIWQAILPKDQQNKTITMNGKSFHITSFAKENDGSVYWYETNTFSYWKKDSQVFHDTLLFIDLTHTKKTAAEALINAVVLSVITNCGQKSSVIMEASTWNGWNFESAQRLSYQQRYEVKIATPTPNDPLMLLCQIASQKKDLDITPENRQPLKAAISL